MANEGGTRVVGVIGKEKSYLCAQISQQKKDALRKLADARGCSVDVVLRKEITRFLKSKSVKKVDCNPEQFSGQYSDKKRITICYPKPLAESFRLAIDEKMSLAFALRMLIDQVLAAPEAA